jgi:hypothetical protein
VTCSVVNRIGNLPRQSEKLPTEIIVADTCPCFSRRNVDDLADLLASGVIDVLPVVIRH